MEKGNEGVLCTTFCCIRFEFMCTSSFMLFVIKQQQQYLLGVLHENVFKHVRRNLSQAEALSAWSVFLEEEH